MVGLRSVVPRCNMRASCMRVFAPPHLLTSARARAYWRQTAVRPGPYDQAAWPSSPTFPHPYLPPRSAVLHRYRPFRHFAAQEAKSPPQSSAAGAAASESPPPTSKSNAPITNAEQRRRDWSIVRRLAVHIWPKDDWTTRGRVVLGVGLLLCGKVRRPTSDFVTL
jgi:hypothetical protein